MAPTGQNIRSSATYMYEYVSATERYYTMFVFVSTLITIRIILFCSNNNVLQLAQQNVGITSHCLLKFVIIDYYNKCGC